MKIPATKIESAVSHEVSRYTINAIKIEPQNKRILATQGHILAVIPFEPEAGDVESLIPVQAIADARKNRKESPVITIEDSKVIVTAGAIRTEHPQVSGTFPNCDAIIPKEKPAFTIALDAALLLKLAQAIAEPNGKGKDASYGIRIHVKDTASAVYIEPMNPANKGAFGLIMPMRAS